MKLSAEVEKINQKVCLFRTATIEDAQELVESYTSVFGASGKQTEHHEAYPAPEVFNCNGIRAIVSDDKREFIVAELNGEIAGAMIITHNDKYHREFGCVMVRQKFRGRGISTRMLEHARAIEKNTSLSVNTTEIVTHSMLSQAAHHKAGFTNIVGFGFCQYPKVFFADHPESCLWICALEGRVAQSLRQSKSRRGENKQEANDYNFDQQSPKKKTSRADEENIFELPLSPEEHDLLSTLRETRNLFIPKIYLRVTSRITRQFEDVLSYRIHTELSSALGPSETVKDVDLILDLCEGEPFAYFHFPNSISRSLADDLNKAWSLVVIAGKRYVQARVPANTEVALQHINLLQELGFIFLGLAPLFKISLDPITFEDIFIMQWIAPEILATNELPGETRSVAKLYGYPLNATGEIVASIKQCLKINQSSGKK